MRIVTNTKEYVVYYHKNTCYINSKMFKKINNEIKFLCFTIKIYDLAELEPLFEKVRRIEKNKARFNLQY
jgi:hypothetical protein